MDRFVTDANGAGRVDGLRGKRGEAPSAAVNLRIARTAGVRSREIFWEAIRD